MLFLASSALILGFPSCNRVIVILPDGRRGKTKGKIVVPVRSVVTFYPKNKNVSEPLPDGYIYWSNKIKSGPNTHNANLWFCVSRNSQAQM